MKIAFDKEGFSLTERRWFGRHATKFVRFADIASVASEKVGKITYDEVFLIIHDVAGNGFVLGELDEGFRGFEQKLRDELEDFPAEWWDDAEHRQTRDRVEVWSKVGEA